MVAEKHVDHAAGGRGFLFETHDKIEDLFGPGAPVEDVAELDEVGLAAGPMEVRVDETDLGVGEDEGKTVVVAVKVGDGHHSLDARPLAGDVGGRGEAGGRDKGQQ